MNYLFLLICLCICNIYSPGADKDNLETFLETLGNFEFQACDNSISLQLRCPFSTSINIKTAQFKKVLENQEIKCLENLNEKGMSVHPSNKISTTQFQDLISTYNSHFNSSLCDWPSVVQYNLLQTVVGNCQKKNYCIVKNFWPKSLRWGNVCPHQQKVAEIIFRCVPGEFKDRIFCYNEVAELNCKRSYRLAIYSAFYGRKQFQDVHCMNGKGIFSETCVENNSTNIVMGLCHGKRQCFIHITKRIFGEACEGIQYLKVTYTCVPRQIFREEFQGQLEPDELFLDEPPLEQPSIYSPSIHHIYKDKTTEKPPISGRDLNFNSGERVSGEYTIWYVMAFGATVSILLGICLLLLSKAVIWFYFERHRYKHRRRQKKKNGGGGVDGDEEEEEDTETNSIPKAKVLLSEISGNRDDVESKFVNFPSAAASTLSFPVKNKASEPKHEQRGKAAIIATSTSSSSFSRRSNKKKNITFPDTKFTDNPSQEEPIVFYKRSSSTILQDLQDFQIGDNNPIKINDGDDEEEIDDEDEDFGFNQQRTSFSNHSRICKVPSFADIQL